MWWRIGTCLAVVLALMVAPWTSPVGAKTADPAAVNLVLNDLPTGFTVQSMVSRNNAQAALVDHKTLLQEIKEGRIRSSDIAFARQALVGMANVDSTIVLFTSEKAATARFRQNVASYRQAVASGKSGGIQEMSLAAVGSQREGIIITSKDPKTGISATGYAAVFIRGTYLVAVVTGGATGTYSADDMLRLARIVDGRIRTRK